MAQNAAYPDLSKIWSEFKVPSPDMTGWLAMQRRTLETLSTVNQVAMESARAVSRRQAEMVQSNLKGMLTTAKDIWTSNSPEANAGKQTQFTKSLFENAVTNARELSEMATKSQSETADMLSRRFVESIEEFSQLAASNK